MKHFVSISLLAVLLGAVGCVHYGSATSPYYSSYYYAYDTYNHCYYHPSRFYRCCGPGLGYVGDGHPRNGGGGTSNFGSGVQHGGGSHRGGWGGGHHGSGSGHSGSGSSHHSGGGGHSHSSSSSSSGGHHR